MSTTNDESPGLSPEANAVAGSDSTAPPRLTWRTDGQVRAVTFGENERGEEYARVKLMGEPAYLMDFDDPDFWRERLRGEWVGAIFHLSENPRRGLVYRVIDEAWTAADG